MMKCSYGNDTYENIQKRRMAAIILDNPELLMMHSQARFDVSITFSPFPFGCYYSLFQFWGLMFCLSISISVYLNLTSLIYSPPLLPLHTRALIFL